ncbi:MAG: CDP-alcohol phosphatidyltransferase family protein [Moraxella sp.]|nr:CDP-alcohol phosphatidyltransferase family protein [Moraxella sp.]
MSLYRLKHQFQNLLRPISTQLVACGATANQVTLGAIALSAITAHVIAKHAKHHRPLWYILPAAMLVRMALNAIDGMMAKEHHQASTLGAWLNEAGDILSDTLLFASLYPHVDKQHHAALSRIIMLSGATELVAIASTLLTGERANHGPLGKSDRAFVLGAIGILVGLNAPIHRHQRLFINAAQLLLILTLINRLRHLRQA